METWYQLDKTSMTEAPHWRCVHCGWKSLGHEITLATAICKCGTGMGRWEACGRTEPTEPPHAT